MCRSDPAEATNGTTATKPRSIPPTPPSSSRPVKLLWSLKDYEYDEKTQSIGTASCLLTGAAIVATLVASEMAWRFLLYTFRHELPAPHLLQDNDRNRWILARHLGVDTLSCLWCFGLAYAARAQVQPVLDWGLRGKPQSLPAAGWPARMFTQQPAAYRLALVFTAYQVKNMYDTIVWNDGPEFIFHHLFSILTSYGAMVTGSGLVYGLFFFGLSEASTAILCVLANFDDMQGVVGLGDAMPLPKVVLGGLFVASFIICRCWLWPIFAHAYLRDVYAAFYSTPGAMDPRSAKHASWLTFFCVSLTGLTILQIAWLGQIFVIGKEELTNMGFL